MDKKYIALTFDDGPSDNTTIQVLEKLEKYGVVASFFLIGNNITPERENIIKKEISLGCDIQNHSLTHSDMQTLDRETIEAEIEETSRRIYTLTGKEPLFFRPPFISVNDLLLETVPLIFINGINGLDWEPDVPAKERARLILKDVRDGAVILLHDMEGNDATVEALDIIIPDLLKQGYEFVTITKLFDIAGINYKNAKKVIYSYTSQ